MNCNLCHSSNNKAILEFGDFPIAHQYMHTLAAKREKYPFELMLCQNCDHVYIANPVNPAVLYENYFTLSDWKFQPHIPQLIKLIQLYGGNRNAKILEVGCNDGRFLKAMYDNGFLNLHGIEPTSDACVSAEQKGIKVIQGFFNQDTAKEYLSQYGHCDVFIIRQVLEHIADLAEFREAIQTVTTDGSLILIEVPDFSLNLGCYDYSLWEEHINYFTDKTLKNFLYLIGVEILHYERFLFSGVGQLVIGRCRKSFASGIKEINSDPSLQASILDYANYWPEFKRLTRDFLSGLVAQGKKIAMYGAGARSATIVNFMELGEYITFVVDDQMEKQNLFMPGSKLEISSSDRLHIDDIDVCLLGVNAENEDKVINKHKQLMSKHIEFYSILPPSKYLPNFWNKLMISLKQNDCKIYS